MNRILVYETEDAGLSPAGGTIYKAYMTKKQLIKWIENNDCKPIIKIIENKIKSDKIKNELIKLQTNTQFTFDGNISKEFRKIKDKYFERIYNTNRNKCIRNTEISKKDYEHRIMQYTLLDDIYKQIKNIVKLEITEYSYNASIDEEEVQISFLDINKKYIDDNFISLSLVISKNYEITLYSNIEITQKFCIANPNYIKQFKEILKNIQNITRQL